jgi:NADPH-dependent glutamate synthase beta subunit-like oxidoreductase
MTERPYAITLDVGSSLANKTGSWRTERPVYLDLLPPCTHACPAGEQVQKWLYDAEDGGYEGAWRQIVADNPLPAVMGRVCFRPCETACNRATLDAAVGINSVERFLGDEAIRRGWALPDPAPPSGKRVLVVGAGPAGLSAAYQLRLLGHAVTISDSGDRPGGMMRYGIPAYRLPRAVLDAEIGRILAMGIDLEPGVTVTDAKAAMAEGDFDAAFLAVGAQVGKRAYIPAGDTAKIIDAISYLHSTADDQPPLLGRTVAVYGGGDTAMDAARTARRLGATDSVIVYRRTRERMPAHDIEVEEAAAEGVRMMWLSTIARADSGTLVIEKMELDETGFPRPTGEFTELAADAVVLALGQDTDVSLVDSLPGVEVANGVVGVADDLMTGHPGLFAGGDMVPGDRTVTVAIGHGKRAARHIDAWLRGSSLTEPTPGPLAGYGRLNTWYYSDAPTVVRPELDVARRITTFDEVVGGLTESNALFEARRCLSCGNCFECDNCFGVCPDNAVIKLGPLADHPDNPDPGRQYLIDLDYCKGCGICAAECPCGAIDMVPEQI